MLKKVKSFFTTCGEIFTATLLALRAIKNFNKRNWWWIGWLYLFLAIIVTFLLWDYYRWATYYQLPLK
jgi:hypothetical protein